MLVDEVWVGEVASWSVMEGSGTAESVRGADGVVGRRGRENVGYGRVEGGAVGGESCRRCWRCVNAVKDEVLGLSRLALISQAPTGNNDGREKPGSAEGDEVESRGTNS